LRRRRPHAKALFHSHAVAPPGSAAYAFAETFSWQEGLDEPFRSAIPFYTIVILSTLLGIGVDLLNINPLKALFYTAVINGGRARTVSSCRDRCCCVRSKIDARPPSPWPSRIIVGLTTIAIFVAAAAMLIL
jgi:hypothetical protein